MPEAFRRVVLRYLVLACSLVPAAGLAATPGKSAKACNEELQKNEAALEAAGETPAAFIHACWWSSKPGEPTPIVGGASAPAPYKTDASRSASDAPARLTRRRASARALVRTVRDEPPARRERRARPGPRFEVEEPVATPVAMPEPVGVRAFDPPTVVDVNLPGVGRVPVPILPGFEPTAQVLVANPVVPELLTIRP